MLKRRGMIDRDLDRVRGRRLTRRTLVLGGVQLALFGGLAARMHGIQVVDRDRYATLADDNRINLRLTAPSRGRILDRFREPLAVNVPNFRAVLVAEEAGDVQVTLSRLSGIVALDDEDWARILRDIGRVRPFVPVAVADHLTWEQVTQIEVRTPELPGLSIEAGETRRYLEGPVMAPVTGYVGAVSEADLTGDPVLTLPGFRIGKGGVEQQHDADLRGLAGRTQVEVNASGRVIREISRDPGAPGQDVQLTIDLGLQRFAQQRLTAERSAAAVVLDVHTGEIYALASNPSYEPNLFADGISTADWRSLTGDPLSPLTNKAIAGEYAPGSTFKLVVATAALEAGLGAGHTVRCGGSTNIGRYRFHCWKRGGHGPIAMVGALEQSCDVYFYDVARRVGIDALAAMAARFGIGGPVGIDLPAERPGLMPTTAWKRATLGEAWQQGETLVAGIGQGYVLATPLQLAVMTARVVNGGRAIRPHVTMRIGETGRPPLDWEAPSMGVAAASLAVVTEGMVRVTSGAHGTGRRSQIDIPGLEIGGKSGTSQVRRITAAERASGVVKNEDKPWEQRDNALFVGFGPVSAPRYAAAVIVEHGGGGSAVAGPIVRDLLREVQQRAPARPLVVSGTAGDGSGQGAGG